MTLPLYILHVIHGSEPWFKTWGGGGSTKTWAYVHSQSNSYAYAVSSVHLFGATELQVLV